MIINRIDTAALDYNGKVMLYNGKEILFNFPVLVVEALNLTFTEQDMGEAVITLNLNLPPDAEPDFSLNWSIKYRGEIFTLKTLSPPGKKDTSSLNYQYDLTFVGERDELKHRLMADMRVLEDGSLQQVSHDFAFFGTLEEFVERFNQNLQYNFPYRWRMQLNPDVEVNPQGVTVACHKLSLWGVLTQVYDLYDVRWNIVDDGGEMVIMVGYPAEEIEYIFEYGRDNGLTSIQRINPLPDIYTRLFGRGGTRNVPHRYFKPTSGTFPGDPDWNEELLTGYFPNLLPKSARDYVKGWNDAKGGRLPAPAANIVPDTGDFSSFTTYGTELTNPTTGVVGVSNVYTTERYGYSDYFDLRPNTIYHISFDIRMTGDMRYPTSAARVRISPDNASEGVQYDSGNIASNGDWVRFSASFTTPSGLINLCRVQIAHTGTTSGGTTGVVYVRNIMVSEGDAEQNWTEETDERTKYYLIGYADQKAGRKLHQPTYAESENIAKWSVREGVVDDNDEIYPSIQGIWLKPLNGVRRGRADEIVAVEAVTNDDWESTGGDAMGTVSPVATKSTFRAAKRTVVSSIKSDMITTSVARNSISYQLNMSWNALSDNTTLSGDIEVRLYNNVGEVVQIQKFTRNDLAPLTRIPPNNTGSFTVTIPGNYYLELYTSLSYSGELSWAGVFGNAWCAVELNQITNKIAAGIGEFKQTFDIWIKDIWGESGSVRDVWMPKIASNEMTVMFSDGLLAGEDYEFIVVKDPKLGNPDAVDFNGKDYWCIWEDTSRSITTVDEDGNSIIVQSKYRLSIQKSDAEKEASGLYLPNTMQNARPGDHFFFINIEMPHQYVLWAEERLQDWLDAELSRLDDEFPTYAINPSSIFCTDFAEVDKLRAGVKIRVRDQQLVGDSYLPLYITSLTLRHTEGKLLPQWSVIVSEEMVGNKSATDTISGEIKRLSSNIYSSQQAIQDAVRMMERTFLRKDGLADTSYSPTRFGNDVVIAGIIKDPDFTQGDFAGSGWGIYKDPQGASVMEVDKLVVRREMRVNEIVVNQVTFVGGKQVFSAAGSKIERIKDVPGNVVRALKPDADTSLASRDGWNITGTANVSFVNLDGVACMKVVAAGSGLYIPYSSAPIFTTGIENTTSLDVFVDAPCRIRVGAMPEDAAYIDIDASQVGQWLRLSNTVLPTGNRDFVVYSGTTGVNIYFKDVKVEVGASATGYTLAAEQAFRCYIDTKEGSLVNQFAVGDQVYHQSFSVDNNTNTSRYYWRLVESVGADYIDLSNDDADGTDAPAAGDNIAQLGNRTNTSRQSAIVMDIVREGGALMSFYDDISTYSLAEKDSINLGRIDGKTWAEVFGNMYIGNRERTKYLKYEDGSLIFRGDIFQASADVSFIDGNFIVTGFLGVGHTQELNSVEAGMTAVDLPLPNPIPVGYNEAQVKVRYWAGSTPANRGSAPWRVWQDGTMVGDKVIVNKGYLGGYLNYNGNPAGGFEIANGRIGVVASGTESTGYGGMTITNDLVKVSGKTYDDTDFWVGIGQNVLPISSGMKGHLRVTADHSGQGRNASGTGLYISMIFDKPDSVFLLPLRHAIYSEGNIRSLGGHVMYNDFYNGRPYYDIIEAFIEYTHSFVFNSLPDNNTAYLVRMPNRATIWSYLPTRNRDVTFSLKVMCTATSSDGRSIVRFESHSDGTGQLTNNNGQAAGMLEIGIGDVVSFRWYNGKYYYEIIRQ